MEYLNIKEYVNKRKEELREASIASGIIPKLGIIDGTAEGDAANQSYIRNKIKDFEELGWKAAVISVEDSVDVCIQTALEMGCTSVIVQLPLRERLEFTPRMLPPLYDCDGFHPFSLCNPATPKGIVDYLDACGFEFKGRHAVIFGRSDIVGKPLAKMLLDRDMTVTVCHSKTSWYDRKKLLGDADLVVCAVGKAKEFNRKECGHAFVVDVGINVGEDGKLCGDFEESPASPGGTSSTPVPGGVGLLTRLALLENCYYLASEGWRNDSN